MVFICEKKENPNNTYSGIRKFQKKSCESCVKDEQFYRFHTKFLPIFHINAYNREEPFSEEVD